MKIKRADLERILILCAAVLVVVLALRGNPDQAAQETVYDTQTVLADVGGEKETVSTVVFYADGDGYLVPVTRQLEKTDGIAKATLNMMVESGQNDLAAARLGLKTVVPEGTSFELDIQDGKARVDVMGASCQTAVEEYQMVGAISNTLLCFSTVDEVSFLFDGQKRSKLTHGTDVSGAFRETDCNLESASVSAGADYVKLYFPSQTGRLLVPVTRAVFSTADVTTAMVELAKGPQSDSGLERALPKDCGIKSVTMKDGTVTVDFTKEFAQIAQETDSGKQTIRAILFTCSQFPGVKRVQLQVEGEKFTPEPESATTFINVEDDVISQYPGVVELD